MDFGTTGNQNSVSSVSEGSRFAGLGDGQGFMEKFKYFISLMEFIATFFTVTSKFCLDFCENWVLTQNWLKNQTSLISKRFLGFVHLFYWSPYKLENFPKYMGIGLYIHFKLKRWTNQNLTPGPKNQNFKVLRFEPNFRGRLNMTREGTPWPHCIKKPLKN